ncbi:MAG: hypothetical protein MUC99_02880 [Anaerolineae bacterium]|jgi:hypothetical protein|nr:hypothetical protein [Anaerolineae bacterium]
MTKTPAPKTTPDRSESDFMERVQAHERNWGNEKYADRPDLIDILRSTVVVFWQHTDPKIKHPTIGLYDDLREVESWFVQMLMRAQLGTPDKRPSAIYAKGHKVIIRDVNITFGTPDA